jgi:hypothetical protein
LKPGIVLLRITGAVLGIQLLLGGLLTFGFISSDAHVAVGFIFFLLTIATMVVWFMTKPAFRPMRIVTTVIVLLVLLQIILGEAALHSGSTTLDFLHFVNALVIFGATFSGMFTAMRWEHMSKAPPSQPSQPSNPAT